MTPQATARPDTSPSAATVVAPPPRASAAGMVRPAGRATAAAASPGANAVANPPANPPAAERPAAVETPRILSVRTSPAVVHDGDTLVWNVRTTPDVVDVVAHVTVYAFRLQKRAVGRYLLSFTIPHGVPGFFHGNYTLDLEARSASGTAASTKVPVSFQ